MITREEKALMRTSNKENPTRTKLTNIRVLYAKKAYGDVLDVGGGIGRFLPFLDGNTFICDIVHEDMFRLKHDKKVVLDADQTLPFKDDSFDVVWASGVCHFLDIERFVVESKRITKNGGKILIMIPNMKSIWNTVKKALGFRAWQDQPGIKKDYSYEDLLKLGGKVEGEISFLPFDGLFRKCLWLSHTLLSEIDVKKEYSEEESLAATSDILEQMLRKLACPYCLPNGKLSVAEGQNNVYCNNCCRKYPIINDTFVFDGVDRYFKHDEGVDRMVLDE